MEKGDRVGRLTVLSLYDVKHGRKRYLCQCDCGNKTIVRQDLLSRGLTNSCGCLMKEWQHQKHRGNKTHGMSRTRIYRIWSGMKGRCCRPSSSGYNDYGGRGITICDEWKNDFTSFYSWAIENGYNDSLSIDRIDVNGNYEPNNCRWATQHEQRINQRQISITYNGETKSLLEWALKTGISYEVLNYRVRSGWKPKEILTTPAKVGNNQY